MPSPPFTFPSPPPPVRSNVRVLLAHTGGRCGAFLVEMEHRDDHVPGFTIREISITNTN